VSDHTVSTSYDRREALIIVNPAAHNAPSERRLEELYLWMQANGWRVSWEATEKRGDGTTMAGRAAERRVPLVIACGGDGTVNEVINGLAGSESTLGTIPAGTSNIWAREVGLDKKLIDCVEAMITGERRKVDLGRVGDRYFLLLAGFGIDAAITQSVPLSIKERVGAAAYAISAAKETIRWQAKPIAVRIDGVERELDVLMAFVGNTRMYAGITRITPTAIVDDGLLDVCIYAGKGRRDILFHTARTLLQLHRRNKNVIYRRARKVEFDWNEPLPVQLDGDPLDYCPNEVRVEPGCLWVAVPADIRTPLFLPKREERHTGELSLPGPRSG
jgi:YegS/Rv2252/BmrU family lipid kinase